MTTDPTPTLAEVVGRNLRRIRAEQGWNQGEVAVRCRTNGLDWTQTTISLLESGQRQIELGEFFALAVALDTRPGGLLEGEGSAIVAGGAEASLESLARLFNKRSQPPEVVVDHLRLDSTWDRIAATAPAGLFTPTVLKAIKRDLSAFIAATENPAELKAARKLGVSSLLIGGAAYRLWGRSLTAERDARVGPDANHATRGRVTRHLVEDIKQLLQEAR